MEVNLAFDVIHEFTLGWGENNDFSSKNIDFSSKNIDFSSKNMDFRPKIWIPVMNQR